MFKHGEFFRYRNGEEITEDQRVIIETLDEGQMSSSLSIEHFTENDVAEVAKRNTVYNTQTRTDKSLIRCIFLISRQQYKVTISNIVGEAETKAKLTLAHIEPSFTESFKRVTEIAEGEALDIRNTVIGSPRPRIKW